MIQEIDKQLQSWATALLPDAEVSLRAPQADPTGRGVSLYLYQLAPAPPGRGVKPPPLQMLARYVVTTWAESAEEAHAMLATLAFGAMADATYTVDLAAWTPESWANFGLSPRPAFVLAILLVQDRRQPVVPRVRRPLEVATAPVVALRGQVLGPDDTPLAGAQVSLPALQIGVRTDGNGFFQLPRVPTQPPTTRLHIQAKAQTQEVDVQPGQVGDSLVIVRFASFDEA
jgi:hypothetical protein